MILRLWAGGTALRIFAWLVCFNPVVKNFEIKKYRKQKSAMQMHEFKHVYINMHAGAATLASPCHTHQSKMPERLT